MKLERRAAALLGVVALVAVPAAVMRVLCVGRSCDERSDPARKVPFCSLSPDTRDAIAAGYRDGRSPDVMAITESRVRVSSRSGSETVPWPALDDPPGRARVIFWGERIAHGAELDEVGLDDVAPTLARLIDFEIPHPEVRSGRAVAGAGTGRPPRLIVEIVVRGVTDVDSDPFLGGLAEQGASGEADLGSLPRDPAALLATIGTGGVPAQHGITGSRLRNDLARVVNAWSSETSPGSVIATLADDLDETLDQEPLIGLVADSVAARGLVGGDWYVGNDRDAVEVVPTHRVVPELRQMLADGFGRDAVPDLIGVSLRASDTNDAAAVLHVLRVLNGTLEGRFAAAIVALPETPDADSSFPARDVVRAVNSELGHEVVEAETAGGFFIDQDTAAAAEVTRADVVAAVRSQIVERYGTKVDKVFADVFPGLSVALARFC